jgi:hypothetical protein
MSVAPIRAARGVVVPEDDLGVAEEGGFLGEEAGQ